MSAEAGTQDTYHHGDLRRAILDAAMQLVEEEGIDGFTLREVARRAGVSHNAPYHHFEDKAAVVAALAEEGYEMLRESQLAALDAADTYEQRIRALGLDYIRFAAGHTARFRLMNRPELRAEGEVTAVQAAGMESEAPLLDTIVEGQQAGAFAVGDVGLLGLAAWSLVHGFATIVVDGPMRAQVTPGPQLDSLAGGAIDVLLDGLRSRSEPSPTR